MRISTQKQSARKNPKRFVFKLSPMAAGCAALLFGMANAAYAQQAEPVKPDVAQADAAKDAPAMQTVTVSGIRRGIEDAISVKKNATSIVEAISAEDIGKLPDTSVAESLARLPGVNAEFVGGRAKSISVRSMPPGFAGNLLNGREQTSTGDSREIYYDQYPSELVSGLVVYKSPDAGLVGQGLAGTIDIQTVRPLDFSKRTIAANYRKEKLNVGLDSPGTGSRESFSYIDQFSDRRLGIALGFARLDNHGGATTKNECWGSSTTTYQGATVNIPCNGYNLTTTQEMDKRNAAMAVIEFKPNKDFSSVLDVFYSKFDSTKNQNILQLPLNQTDTNVYHLPTVLTAATLSGSDVQSGTFSNVRAVVRNEPVIDNELSKSIGWKNSFKVGDGWKAVVDLSHNTAERIERDQEVYASTLGPAGGNISFTRGSYGMTSSVNFADPNIIKITDGQGWGGGVGTPQAGYSKGPTVNDKLDALKLSGKHDLPEGWMFSDVDFGMNYTKRNKTRIVTEGLLQVAAGPLAGLDIPGAGSGSAGDSGLQIVTFDASGTIPGLNFVEKLHPDIYNKDWTVNEKMTTAYAKLDIDTEVAKLPVRGNVGFQLIRTVQDSTAFHVDRDSGTSDANRLVAPFSGGKTLNDVLPSLNLAADLGNDQTLRFALAKVMSRPDMIDLSANNVFSADMTKTNPTTGKPGLYVGSGGNPNLDPFRATGVDLSYEKYFGKKAYLAAAAFYKKIDSYIIKLPENYDFTSSILPTTIPLSSNTGIFTRPTNGHGGSIEGVELSGSLPFDMLWKPLNGFGISANGTYTKSTISLPDITLGASTLSGASMALPGLSRKSGGFSLYYEKYGFSARVSETYRSDYIGEVIAFGGDRQLTHIQSEKHVSAQIAYDFDSGIAQGLSLIMSVDNLTNQPYVRTNYSGSTELENSRFGRTILFGVNYKL